MKKSGFTLIELMVVIVVICVLAAATFKIMGNMDENDKIAKTKATMEKVAMALEAYKAIYGKYPPVHQYDETMGDETIGQPCWFEFPVYDYEQYPAWDNTAAGQLTRGDGREEVSWNKAHVFTFGLCAFFLPRYSVVMDYGCQRSFLGLTDDDKDGHADQETWGEAEKNHIFGQWQRHNRRRADSAVADSARDVAAARKILPYLDASMEGNGKVNLKNSLFHVTGQGGVTERFKTPRKVETRGGNFEIPVCSISIWDCFDENNTVYEDAIKNSRALRYLSRPPFESYELRSSGPDRKFGTVDDIVIGAK